MTEATFDTLVQVGARLEARAAGLEYLCELSLDGGSGGSGEVSLDRLMAMLRTHRGRLNERRETRFALAVAAVNWAYTRAPDQEFRESFTATLLRPHEQFSDKLWEEELGRLVERALLALGLLTQPGFGPYRYVGAIREQAGVTESEIPAFADLLAALEVRGISPSAREEEALVLALVDSVLGGHTRLARFLRSPAGLHLVRDTASLVSTLRGDETWLADAVGYPPGFLVRLWHELGRARAGVPGNRPTEGSREWSGAGSTAGPAPELWFDHLQGAVVLRFPAVGSVFAVQIPTPRAVGSRDLVIGRDIAVHEVYAGTAEQGGVRSEWCCVGWPPDGLPLVLFDENGRALSVRDLLEHSRGAVAACVFRDDAANMLSSSYRSARTAELTSRRSLALDGDAVGHRWCIVDIGLTEVRRALARFASIAWAEPVPESGLLVRDDAVPVVDLLNTAPWGAFAATVSAFDRELVAEIRGWSTRAARRFMVIAHCDDGRIVECVPVRRSDGRYIVSFRPETSLCSGSLRVVAKGRLRAGHALPPPWRFAVADGLHASPPATLLSAAETGFVGLRSPPGCRIEALSPGTVVAPDGAWVDGPNGRWGVQLSLGKHRVMLEGPVHRAGLDWGFARALVLDPLQMTDAGGGEVTLTVRGLPDTIASLRVDDPSSGGAIDVLAVQLDDQGIAVVAGQELLDRLGELGVSGGQFAVACSGRLASTGKWYIDVERTTSAAPLSNPPTNLPVTVLSALETIARIRQDVDVDESRAACIEPSSLARRVESWLDVRHAVDRTGARSFGSAHAALCRAVSRAKECVLDRTVAVDKAAAALEALVRHDPSATLRADGLLLPRWKESLSRFEVELRRAADATGILRAWVRACRSGEAVSPAPPAGMLNVGRALALADPSRGPEWRIAMHALQNPAMLLPSPWDEVRDALLVLCLLRAGHVRAAVRACDAAVSRLLPGVGRQLAALHGLLGRDDWVPAPESAGVDLISPRPDDAALAAALSGGPAEWRIAARCSWMHAWLGWRAAVLGGPAAACREEMLGAAHGCFADLPSSLEMDRVRAELNDDQPEDWHAG